MHSNPLVSIVVYNYNYGKYLSTCFDSIINQDYSNIEILFSDNASIDNSWEIALSYSRKFPDLFFLARNRKNFGASANLRNCMQNVRGEYLLFLASDDYIKPNYISTCVDMLQKHADAAFVMVHRLVIGDDGKEICEAPFYDNSYKLYPPSQAGVYFMSPINPCISQVFYRTKAIGTTRRETFNDLFYGHRLVDFQLSLQMPIIYLKDALTIQRVHNESDSENITENLIQIIGHYVLNHQFNAMMSSYDFNISDKKFEKSFKRLAEVSLKYSVNSIIRGKTSLAKKYWYLSATIDLDTEQSALGKMVREALVTNDASIIKELQQSEYAKMRTVSYLPDPPFEKI